MDTYAPYFFVEIGGTKLPKNIRDHVTSFEYEDDEEKMDMFTLVIEDPDMILVDDPLLQENKEIRTRWGYLGHMSPLHTCTIKEIDYQFGDNRVPRLTLKALDKGHCLTGRASRQCWKNAKVAVIGEDIARKHGFGTAFEIPDDYPRENIAQGGKNDMEFLKELAAEHACQVWVENKTLHIEPSKEKAPAMKFTWGKDRDGYLLNVSIKSNAEKGKGTAAGTQTAIIDPKTGKAVTKNTSASKEMTTVNLNSGKEGSETPEQKKADEAGKITQTAADTPKSAAQASKAAVQNAGRKAIKATAVTVGIPTLTAKSTVTIEGIGKKFSGRWRVTKVRHSITTGGYKCSLELTKGDISASGKGGKKAENGGQGKAGKPGQSGGANGDDSVKVNLNKSSGGAA